MNWYAVVSNGTYPTSGASATYWPQLIISYGLMDETLPESTLVYLLAGLYLMGMHTTMT